MSRETRSFNITREGSLIHLFATEKDEKKL
jgi:hypothetical protein